MFPVEIVQNQNLNNLILELACLALLNEFTADNMILNLCDYLICVILSTFLVESLRWIHLTYNDLQYVPVYKKSFNMTF